MADWVADPNVSDGWTLPADGVSVAVIYPLAEGSIAWQWCLFESHRQWPPHSEGVMVSEEAGDVMAECEEKLVNAGICRHRSHVLG